MPPLRDRVPFRLGSSSVALPLFLASTLLASGALYASTIAPDSVVQITSTGVFLLGFLGQGVAVVLGTRRSTRLMLRVAIALLLGTLVVLVTGEATTIGDPDAVRNVARGLAVATMLAVLGYIGRILTAPPTD